MHSQNICRRAANTAVSHKATQTERICIFVRCSPVYSVHLCSPEDIRLCGRSRQLPLLVLVRLLHLLAELCRRASWHTVKLITPDKTTLWLSSFWKKILKKGQKCISECKIYKFAYNANLLAYKKRMLFIITINCEHKNINIDTRHLSKVLERNAINLCYPILSPIREIHSQIPDFYFDFCFT